jgi:hypothetical protein
MEVGSHALLGAALKSTIASEAAGVAARPRIGGIGMNFSKTRRFGLLSTASRRRRMLLLAGLSFAVWPVGSALTPPVAPAAGSRQPISAAKATQCLGTIHACAGYRYTCVSALYPKQLAVHTDSEKIEDTLESDRYRWHCQGTRDD